ncbi:hypothetical protein ASC93_09540 [Massilia sp. Root335]|nr:hypothetical protein ASC93_09540 [Massilia sp. Root335]
MRGTQLIHSIYDFPYAIFASHTLSVTMYEEKITRKIFESSTYSRAKVISNFPKVSRKRRNRAHIGQMLSY